MKNLLVILLLFTAAIMRGQSYNGVIEKSGGDYYFHGIQNDKVMPALIVIFTEMDTIKFSKSIDTLPDKERPVSVTGEINDSAKVYRRGLPFGTIKISRITNGNQINNKYGLSISQSWDIDNEHTTPQQDTIFEVYYVYGFHDIFLELKNGKLQQPVGAASNKYDDVVGAFWRDKKWRLNTDGVYLKVKAKRWYGAWPVSGNDASFDYLMEATEVLEADTTRTRWGYYANEIENGRPVTLFGTTIKNFPDDFTIGKVYKYKGKINRTKVRLELEKTSGSSLKYSLIYGTNKKERKIVQGVLKLNFDSYAQASRSEPYEFEYNYENESIYKPYFSINLFTQEKDITKIINLKDTTEYQHPGISCNLKRVK